MPPELDDREIPEEWRNLETILLTPLARNPTTVWIALQVSHDAYLVSQYRQQAPHTYREVFSSNHLVTPERIDAALAARHDGSTDACIIRFTNGFDPRRVSPDPWGLYALARMMTGRGGEPPS